MKKRFVSILLVAAMTASLAACGGSNGGDNSASATEKGGKTESASDGGEITLTIPTFFVGENVGAVYFEPAVERFNEANKGKYHIELEEVVEASYTDKISQLAQSDALPALIQTPDKEWIQTAMIPGKLYYPMNDFLDEHPEDQRALCRFFCGILYTGEPEISSVCRRSHFLTWVYTITQHCTHRRKQFHP